MLFDCQQGSVEFNVDAIIKTVAVAWRDRRRHEIVASSIPGSLSNVPCSHTRTYASDSRGRRSVLE